MKKVVRLNENELKHMIMESVKRVLKEDNSSFEQPLYYCNRLLYYPERKVLAGDMGYQICDVGEDITSEDKNSVIKNIIEYLKYDYPQSDKEEMFDDCVVVLYVDILHNSNDFVPERVYISNIDKQYAQEIAKAFSSKGGVHITIV